jgi:uncharacterized protein YigA (DUF484 family)
MRKLFTILGVVAFLCSLVIAGSETSNNNVQTELLQLEQQMLDSASAPDLPTLRKMLADDFMGTAFGPRVLSKTDIVPPDGTTANHLQKLTLGQSTVRVYGDTAVLMGAAQAADPGDNIRITTVFQKRPAAWQIIAIDFSPEKQ